MTTGWKTAGRYMIGAATIGLVALGGVQASSRYGHPTAGNGSGRTEASLTAQATSNVPRGPGHVDGSSEGGTPRTGDDRPQARLDGPGAPSHAGMATGSDISRTHLEPPHAALVIDGRPPAPNAHHGDGQAAAHRVSPQDAILEGPRALSFAVEVAETAGIPMKKAYAATTLQATAGLSAHTAIDLQDGSHPNHGGGPDFALPFSHGETSALPANELFSSAHGGSGGRSETTFHLSAGNGTSLASTADESAHALKSPPPIQSPVPEPETWAMLACGALMVVWTTRRQRARTI